MVAIMTHDREPPLGFPWGDGADCGGLAVWYPCLRGLAPAAGSRRAYPTEDAELTLELVFKELSPLERDAERAAGERVRAAARRLDRGLELGVALRGEQSGYEAKQALSRRTVAHSSQPLGASGEVGALGTEPASPDRKRGAASEWTPTKLAHIEHKVALSAFEPPPELELGLRVEVGDMLRVLQADGDIVAVRNEAGTFGFVTADVIGRRGTLNAEERAELVGGLVAAEQQAAVPPPDRRSAASGVMLPAAPGDRPLNLNRTPKGKMAQPKFELPSEGGSDDSDDPDWDMAEAGSDGGSDGGGGGSSSAGAPKRRKLQLRASAAAAIGRSVFDGTWPNDLLHCPLTLESAATAVGTRTLQSKMRLMRDDAIESATRAAELAAPDSGAPPPPPALTLRRLNWSADQQEHNHAHTGRELQRRALVDERQQKQLHLEQLMAQRAAGGDDELDAELDAELAASVVELEARLAEISTALAGVGAEQFRLGVSHAAAILGRTVFQLAPCLADWLTAAVPGLQPIITHITEIKNGCWLLTHVLLEHMCLAWTAFRLDLSDASQSADEQRAASPTLKLFDWVIERVVLPAVRLNQAGRGRDASGRLTAAQAWPLFLAALKAGLRVLLLSGRHPFYVDCFGRELRDLYQLSEEELARWAYNIWATVGGSRFTNDECVERFAVLVLKEALKGSFSEEVATRMQALVEAVESVRRAQRQQTGGEAAEARAREREHERRVTNEPAIAAALARELHLRLAPVIQAELRASSAVSRAHSAASTARAQHPNPDPNPNPNGGGATGGEVVAVARVARDGSVKLTLFTPARLLQTPIANAFVEPPVALVNTDTDAHGRKCDEMVERYAKGRWLSKGLGFRYDAPPQKLSHEAAVVIGPAPRGAKTAAGGGHGSKKRKRDSQQLRARLHKGGVQWGPWALAAPEVHPWLAPTFWQLATNTAKAGGWPALCSPLMVTVTPTVRATAATAATATRHPIPDRISAQSAARRTRHRSWAEGGGGLWRRTSRSRGRVAMCARSGSTMRAWAPTTRSPATSGCARRAGRPPTRRTSIWRCCRPMSEHLGSEIGLHAVLQIATPTSFQYVKVEKLAPTFGLPCCRWVTAPAASLQQ